MEIYSSHELCLLSRRTSTRALSVPFWSQFQHGLISHLLKSEEVVPADTMLEFQLTTISHLTIGVQLLQRTLLDKSLMFNGVLITMGTTEECFRTESARIKLSWISS